jgi:hypothetical protein
MREKVLRQYVREAILLEKSKGGSIFSGLSLNPKKWFDDFMERQLDKFGEKIADAMSDKLDSILPDDFKEEIESRGQSTQKLGEAIAKAVDEWIDHAEEQQKREYSVAEKKQLYSVAVQSFNKYVKSGKDTKSALYAMTRDLDSYASKNKKT